MTKQIPQPTFFDSARITYLFMIKCKNQSLRQRFLIVRASLIFVCVTAPGTFQSMFFNSARITYLLYAWDIQTPQPTFFSDTFIAYLCMLNCTRYGHFISLLLRGVFQCITCMHKDTPPHMKIFRISICTHTQTWLS